MYHLCCSEWTKEISDDISTSRTVYFVYKVYECCFTDSYTRIPFLILVIVPFSNLLANLLGRQELINNCSSNNICQQHIKRQSGRRWINTWFMGGPHGRACSNLIVLPLTCLYCQLCVIMDSSPAAQRSLSIEVRAGMRARAHAVSI